MADNILRLRVESSEYDAKLKKAAEGIRHLAEVAHKGGGDLTGLEKAELDYVKALGSMETKSRTAAGGVRELESTFKELTVVYNNLNDVEKQDEGGKALRASLDQIKRRAQEARAELDAASKSLQGAEAGMNGGGGLFSGIGSKMEGALAVFGGNVMTKAAGAVAQLGSEMVGLVQQGIEMAKQGEGVRIAFERLGRGDLLQGLREATHGTVTDLELMKAAVQFNDFKLPLDELGTMLAFAQQKAKDTGQSVDYLVQSIVTGLGRKSLMILDNLGLSATEIRERMKETGDMTKAVGAIIRDQMAAAGDYVETAADRAAQANVSLQNKMEELGRKFAPVEEASNQLWTSMKIGILDIVGGPLARLLNDLTEAGRLKNALNDINGDGSNGAETRSGKALRILREYSGGGRGIEGKRELYDRQVASFQNQEEKEWRKANRLRDELAGLRKQQREDGTAGNLQPLIDDTTRQLEAAESRAKAFQIARNEYVKGAKDILKPVNVNVSTKQAEQNVASLRRQLKELEEQRKKAIAAGDTELSKNLAKQITQTKADIKGLGGTTIQRTNTTSKTEEQQNQTRIAELVKQYQDLATAAKTANDAQKTGLTERMAKIQGEITTLQERNTELKKFADEAQQVQYPVGSLPQLNEQLKTLQTEQAKALDAKQWQDYQQQIEQTQYQIDALKGKWKDGLQATFKLNIEQQGTTGINTAKPDDITVTFRADDTDVLSKVRDIEGVTIDPKTLTVTAQTQEAIAALQRVDGLTILPKTAEVTFRADDADVLAKVRDIEGVTFDDKTLTVTAQTQEAITALQRVDGLTIKPKTAEVTFRADNADVFAKLRDIDGVSIDPKTLTVTAETQEAITALQRVDGLTILPKTAEVTFRADDADVLAKVRDIDGVTIDDKTMSVTANTAEAYNKVQELLKSVDGKTVTFAVQPKMETGTSIQNNAGMSGYIASIKQQLETADYGTSLYNGLSAQLADMTTLQNLVGASLKAGLGTAMFGAADATGKDFWTRAMEGSVEDTDWQTIIDKINEKLKGLGIEPIKINFETGNIANVGKETEKSWRGAASAMSAAGSALQGLEDPGAKIAGIVGQAIANIALGFSQATAASSGGGVFGWIAAIAGGLTTMLSTISAIHSATGYAQGGIVDGRGGGFVGGMAYSGDNVGNVRLDSGELVLNRSQQGVIANALEGGNALQNLQLDAVIKGEQIRLVLNNNGRRTGRGEYVQTNRR